MGGFALLHRRQGVAVDGPVATALGVFRDMGSPAAIEVDGEDYVFRYFPKTLDPRHQFLDLGAGRFLAAVGTLVYRSAVGAEALRQLAQRSDIADELPRCRGHFILIEGGPRGLRMLRDPSAAIEVFHDPARGVFSTSFLAVARTLPRRVLRRQEAYEYLFHGHTLGTDTVIDGIRRLDEGEQVAIGKDVRVHQSGRPVVPRPATGDRRTLAGKAVDVLSESLSEVCTAFAGRASLALSGGYDTRLVLGLARRIGVMPDLFVYGAAQSPDVVVAQHIAQREGLSLQHIDKSELCPEVAEADYLNVIRQNYLDADGMLPGGIFKPPAEAIARRLRHRDGAVALHGGGGEAFRNFFGLPNRSTSTLAIAKLFFRVPRGVATPGFSEASYAMAIAAKMDAMLGTPAGAMSRHDAEALYPRFRYRFWVGKELTLNARAGYCYMPMFEAEAVRVALAMPVPFKDHGNLEAEMIRIADPALARHPSNYGHNFSGDAPARQACRDWLMQQRPAWFRQAIFRYRSGRGAEARAWHEEWADEVLGLDLPVMRDLVMPRGLRCSESFENGCNLSVLIRDLQISDLV